MATECFCLVVDEPLKNEMFTLSPRKLCSIGEYAIEWRRKNPTLHTDTNQMSSSESDEEEETNDDNRNILNTHTAVKLPDINIESFPFLIETNLPTHGSLDKHLTINYKIKNKTKYSVLDLECMLDENEFFSITGNKLVIDFLLF